MRGNINDRPTILGRVRRIICSERGFLACAQAGYFAHNGEATARKAPYPPNVEGKLWQSNQRRYATILRKRGLSTTRQAPSAFARVQKAVFDILGFAWVGSDGRATITPTGRKFLSGQPLEKMIRKQLCKYQLWNPAAVAKFKDFRILPHVFLIQVLLRFQTRVFLAMNISFSFVELPRTKIFVL